MRSCLTAVRPLVDHGETDGVGWMQRACARTARQWGEGASALACQRPSSRLNTSSPTPTLRSRSAARSARSALSATTSRSVSEKPSQSPRARDPNSQTRQGNATKTTANCYRNASSQRSCRRWRKRSSGLRRSPGRIHPSDRGVLLSSSRRASSSARSCWIRASRHSLLAGRGVSIGE